jgi:single-strand DNA-binding protein
LGHKGRSVRVVGRLKQERWNDTDGKARAKIAIIAEHVEFRPEVKGNSISNESEEIVESDNTVEEEETVEIGW